MIKEHRYRICHDGTILYDWFVKSDKGAVHLWLTPTARKQAKGIDQWYGGFMVHYAKPFESMPGEPATSERCWILEAPCWHSDSAGITEYKFIFLNNPQNHDVMFEALEKEHVRIFKEKEYA